MAEAMPLGIGKCYTQSPNKPNTSTPRHQLECAKPNGPHSKRHAQGALCKRQGMALLACPDSGSSNAGSWEQGGQRHAANSCQLTSDEGPGRGRGTGGQGGDQMQAVGSSPVGGREEGVGEGGRGRGRLQTVGSAALQIVGCCDRDNG